jgi:hypothetical protein
VGAAKRKEIDFSERLTLSEDATCTANSVELTWRPPTKNSERVEKYKLMIASTTGTGHTQTSKCNCTHLRAFVPISRCKTQFL